MSLSRISHTSGGLYNSTPSTHSSYGSGHNDLSMSSAITPVDSSTESSFLPAVSPAHASLGSAQTSPLPSYPPSSYSSQYQRFPPSAVSPPPSLAETSHLPAHAQVHASTPGHTHPYNDFSANSAGVMLSQYRSTANSPRNSFSPSYSASSSSYRPSVTVHDALSFPDDFSHGGPLAYPPSLASPTTSMPSSGSVRLPPYAQLLPSYHPPSSSQPASYMSDMQDLHTLSSSSALHSRFERSTDVVYAYEYANLKDMAAADDSAPRTSLLVSESESQASYHQPYLTLDDVHRACMTLPAASLTSPSPLPSALSPFPHSSADSPALPQNVGDTEAVSSSALTSVNSKSSQSQGFQPAFVLKVPLSSLI